LYVYGITLKGLELKDDARRILLESVQAFPCNWSAWLDIISILASKNVRMDQRISKPQTHSLVF
jgi:anaphase-promoting complex subunit 8